MLTAQLAGADLTTETSTTLDTSIATPTTVAAGANSFTIRLWATSGDAANKSGRIDVVTSYSMSTTGTVTPGTTTTTVTFPTTFKLNSCDGSGDPSGCQSNPFTVTATLNVAPGTPNGTVGTVLVKLLEQANSGVNADASPASGFVRVGGANAAPTVGAITGAASQSEGSTGSYAVVASDPDGDSLTYAWSTSSNASISGPANTASAMVTFPDGPTTATVSVSVDDQHGHVLSRSTTVTVSNVAPSALAVAPTSVVEGSPIAIALSGASDPSSPDTAAGFTYAFDCGAGYGATTSTPSATCPTNDDGSRTVKARIADRDGGSREYTTTVSVTNAAPTAVFSPSSPVDEGSDITLSFLGATDVSSADVAAGFTYAFDCGAGFGAFTTSTIAGCTTNDSGTRTVKGAVRDKDGGATTYTVSTVEVRNVAPTAIFGTTSTVGEGTAIPLSLTGADDPSTVDAASLSYAFDCGTGAGYGATSTVAAVLCPTTDQGDRTVKAKVADKDGGYTEYTQGVTVTNVAPTAMFSAPDSVPEGSPITLSLANVEDPSAADTDAGFTYAFDCGAGYGVASTSLTSSCTTADEGTRTVKGKVIDKDGGATEYVETVSITNVAPNVMLGEGATLAEGDTLTRGGSFTDPGADTWSAIVDYGDGSSTQTVSITGTTFTLSHVYAQDAHYDVTVIVGDGTDASAASFRVDVTNVAPAVSVGDGSAPEGTTLTASGSFTDPGADKWSATVDYGDGTGPATLTLATDKTFALAHTYADDGTYTVSVAVVDDDTTSVTTATAVVTNGTPVVDAGPDRAAVEGAQTTGSVTFTDLGADTWVATVDYGDGSTESVNLGTNQTFELAHTYADDGSYTVAVAVADDEGAIGGDAFEVVVANVAPIVNAGADQAVAEGSAFHGAGSFTDPGADPWSATVDYGDGGGATTLTLADDHSFELDHTYADNGVYTVTVVVGDGDDTGTSTATVTVSNVGPTVDAGPGATIDEGGTFTGGGTFSDPGADDPWTATVAYGDGTTGTLGLTGKSFSLEHRYTDEGTYLAVVTVTDKDGAPGSGSTTVTVANVAPTVDAGADATIDEGGTFSRHGMFTDPGADVWTGAVDYGDGTTASIAVDGDGQSFDLAHVYPRDGSYSVVVTIDDHDGGVSTDTVVVTVDNVAPLVSAGGDDTLQEGGSLARGGSFADPGDDVWQATVDYGDGTTATLSLTGKAFALAHTYAQDGAFTVTVSVGDGATVSVGTFVVTVTNVLPAVTVHAGTADEASVLTVTGSFTDPGADAWSATVDYGDGTTGTISLAADKSFSFDHVYADDGSFVVAVTVRDDDGAGSNTDDAVVANVAPSLSQIAALASFEGSLVQTTATFTDPGADTWQATVDYGDGTPVQPLGLVGTSFGLGHTYADNGTYTVTVSVTDDDGGTGSTTATVVVANVAPTVSAGPDGAAEEGSPFASGGSFTDPGADVWTASVDYGDGGGSHSLALTGTTFTLAHVYVDNGVYTVTVTVDDGDDTGTSTATVSVTNVAPAVDAGAGDTIDEGDTFAGAGSVDDPGALVTFSATVDYEGLGASTLTVASDRTFALSHRYLDNGTFRPTVVVTDKDGGVGEDSTTVTVRNVAPTVTVGDGGVVDEGSLFTASGSFADPGSDTWSATAAYGDATGTQVLALTGTTFTLSHVYANDGVYTATATVTDDDGGVGADSTSVTVRNVAPTVDVGSDATADEGGPFSQSGSFTDPGADTWSASVDYGDSSGAQPLAVNGKSFSLAHTYAQDGSYTVTVTVRDGVDEDTDTLVVTVRNVAPAVSVHEITAVDEGGAASITGSFDDPGADAPWTATVDYGDGTTATVALQPDRTFSLAHTYVQDGSYTVAVTVADDDTTGSGRRSATVRNVLPTISSLTTSVSFSTACLSGTAASLRFGVTDPGTADHTTATVDWGDTATSTFASRAIATSHSFAAGRYTIRVAAADEHGTGAEVTATVSNLYARSGILQPINADGTSVFKKGSTIPVKIRVTDCNGTPVGTLAPSVALRKVGAGTTGDVEVVSTSAADTGQTMRWDGSAGQYIYNLSTKRSTFNNGADLADGRYELTISSPTFDRVVVEFTLKQ
ncbi:MAG TPA: PKD domain-containing protein [Acidimicrobiales bacterium]|nr:PKD domain-containing protein [Acidimicrobiales bacterium]